MRFITAFVFCFDLFLGRERKMGLLCVLCFGTLFDQMIMKPFFEKFGGQFGPGCIKGDVCTGAGGREGERKGERKDG